MAWTQGLGGLEHSYDEIHPGNRGIVARPTAAFHVARPTGDPVPAEGFAVVSIDSGIQFAAEQALSEAVIDAQAKSGVAILLDPTDGSILAMATAPGFDPNEYGRFSADERRNRAIADAHEPGSTFKVVTGAVALENSVVTLDETIDTGDGTIRVGNTVISEPTASSRRAHARRRVRALPNVGISGGVAARPAAALAGAPRSASAAPAESIFPARTPALPEDGTVVHAVATRRSRWARKFR